MAVYKNVASQKVAVYAYDTANDTPKTGDAANITAQISLDGAATAATNDTNPTELDATDAPGVYLFDMTQAETNADLVILFAKSSSADIVLEPVFIYTTPGDNAALTANVTEIGGDTQSATDLKDFADTGYNPTSHKVAGVALVDTCTTNTDMRGTNSALLATSAPANFGDLAITASTGLVTVGTNNDKTGYSLTAGTGLGNQTADITGSLSGSVGSVTGGINTAAGTITTLDGLDTAQDTQHSTTQSAISGLNNLSTADIDARLAAYDGPTNAEMVAAFTEIKGATWSSTTDTLEAIRDRGDSAWITATGFSTIDAAGIRTAVGLSTANLDTQLGEIVTDTGTTIPGFLASIIGDTNELQTDWANGGRLDLLIDGIKAVTDAIPDSGAMTSISTFDVSSDTVITASIYTARVDLTIDGANSQDEYTVQWLKNGAPVAVTGTPQIQVVKRADGTDLVAATNMTQIGSVNGAYKYDEGTNRITAGEAVLITCTATIDAVTRTWTVPLARDSS